MPAQTRFEVFVTLAWPTTVSEFPDITYRRMKHAVTKVSEAASIDPHAIVKNLMGTFKEFSLGVNPMNAWLLGEPGAAGVFVGSTVPVVSKLLSVSTAVERLRT